MAAQFGFAEALRPHEEDGRLKFNFGEGMQICLVFQTARDYLSMF